MKSLILFVLGMCGTPAAKTVCDRTCDTIASCGDEWATQSCKDDCALQPTDPQIATCIVDSGCATIRKRLAMNNDITALCKSSAR